MRRLTTTTGYVALALIALTLLIGPINLLLRRSPPVSSYLRRDVGLCATAVSVAHVVFGFLVKHSDGAPLSYFVESSDRTSILTNSFGLANWAGMAAALIVTALAAISNDVALRRLRARRWKRLQRWNYPLAVLAVVHAVLYGALWRLDSPYTVSLIALVVVVSAAQAIGVRLWRRRRQPIDAPAHNRCGINHLRGHRGVGCLRGVRGRRRDHSRVGCYRGVRGHRRECRRRDEAGVGTEG